MAPGQPQARLVPAWACSRVSACPMARFPMASSWSVKEPPVLETAVVCCSVPPAGGKVLWRHLGTGEDTALEAGPAHLPSALAPVPACWKTMVNSFSFCGCEGLPLDRTGALHTEKWWWALCGGGCLTAVVQGAGNVL